MHVEYPHGPEELLLIFYAIRGGMDRETTPAAIFSLRTFVCLFNMSSPPHFLLLPWHDFSQFPLVDTAQLLECSSLLKYSIL